jgi:hypothetical protein
MDLAGWNSGQISTPKAFASGHLIFIFRIGFMIFPFSMFRISCLSRLRPQRSTATSRLYRPCRSSHSLHCISAAPAALDRYLAALPAMSLIPFAPFRFLICEVFTAEDAENAEPTWRWIVASKDFLRLKPATAGKLLSELGITSVPR